MSRRQVPGPLIQEKIVEVIRVVDSEDLPLDISGETLLRNKILRVIKKNYVTKYLDILAEIAELNAAYRKFYEHFGERLKLGNDEESTVGVKTAEVLRLSTSKLGDEQSSFQEYVDRMKEGLARALPLCLLLRSWKICARKVLRRITLWTPRMNMQCNGSRNSAEKC